MSSGTSTSNPGTRQRVVSHSHGQGNYPERPLEGVDLDKVLDTKRSGGSFGDAFGRSNELQGEVSPKRGAAIDAQLKAEDEALLQQKQARKSEFEPKEAE